MTTDRLANPAPLGLLGFGLTTILLNLHNIGLTTLSATILAMGIFYGGLAQLFAGLMEFRKGNTFGTAAFTSYGLFWLALVAIIMLPEMKLATAPTSVEMAWFLGLWGTLTVFFFLGTLRNNRAIQFVFASLALLFLLLAIGDATGIKEITQLAGLVGIICGASAFYTAMAEVLNEVYKKEVLPLFAVRPRQESEQRSEAEVE